MQRRCLCSPHIGVHAAPGSIGKRAAASRFLVHLEVTFRSAENNSFLFLLQQLAVLRQTASYFCSKARIAFMARWDFIGETRKLATAFYELNKGALVTSLIVLV